MPDSLRILTFFSPNSVPTEPDRTTKLAASQWDALVACDFLTDRWGNWPWVKKGRTVEGRIQRGYIGKGSNSRPSVSKSAGRTNH